MLVDGLFKAMGLWKWSVELDDGEEIPLSDCDKTIAYRVGPEVIIGDLNHYVNCVIAKGEIVKLTAGNLGDFSACSPVVCNQPLGVLWNTETSGRIFALDEDGHPMGAAQGTLVVRGMNSLVFAGLAGDADNGYLMSRQGGNNVLCSE